MLEHELIARIRERLARDGAGVEIGPGDDCAGLVPAAGRTLLATCDALVEGRHFRRDGLPPESLGAKLAAINLSDVAAMGGEARWALLSLALPADLAGAWAVGVAAGVAEALAAHGASLVGGNLASIDGPVVADLTLLGDVASGRALRRSGARGGDVVVVTGTLGAAAAGLEALERGLGGEPRFAEIVRAHRRPVPRIREGRILAASGRVHAAVDVSDGLVTDLAHVCEESGVAAEIDLDRLPISPATRAAARELGRSAERWAAAGGEDYELVATIAPADLEAVARAIAEGEAEPLTVVGRVVEGKPEVRRTRSGRAADDDARGWDHFARSGRTP